MRGWLDGKGYFIAAEALEIVRLLEQGTRKDQQTPKFHHQLSVARLLSTLAPHMIYPEATLATAFLHDLCEDHGVLWTRGAIEAKFGKQIGEAVWTITKKSVGMSKDYDSYFAQMGQCPIASLVKLADRAHNLLTMQGVFTYEKQKAYVSEVKHRFHPMLKVARRKFPQQRAAYENLKIFLLSQVRLINHILETTALPGSEQPTRE